MRLVVWLFRCLVKMFAGLANIDSISFAGVEWFNDTCRLNDVRQCNQYTSYLIAWSLLISSLLFSSLSYAQDLNIHIPKQLLHVEKYQDLEYQYLNDEIDYKAFQSQVFELTKSLNQNPKRSPNEYDPFAEKAEWGMY